MFGISECELREAVLANRPGDSVTPQRNAHLEKLLQRYIRASCGSLVEQEQLSGKWKSSAELTEHITKHRHYKLHVQLFMNTCKRILAESSQSDHDSKSSSSNLPDNNGNQKSTLVEPKQIVAASVAVSDRSRTVADTNDSWLDNESNLNQTSSFILSGQSTHIKLLAQKLMAHELEDDPERSEVLQQLLQLPSNDIGQSGTPWTQIRGCLSQLLSSEAHHEMATKFILKMLNSPNAQIITDTFITLCESAKKSCVELLARARKSAGTYKDVKAGGNRRRVATAMHQQNSRVRLHMLVMRLWHAQLLAVANFWLRHPNQLLASMIDAVCDVLQLRPTVGDHQSGGIIVLGDPLVALALLDDQARWFRAWMHQQFGREQLLKCWQRRGTWLFVRRMFGVAVQSEHGQDTSRAYSAPASEHLSGQPALLFTFTDAQLREKLWLYCYNSTIALLASGYCRQMLLPLLCLPQPDGSDEKDDQSTPKQSCQVFQSASLEDCVRRLADVCHSGRRPMYVPRLLLLVKAIENNGTKETSPEEIMKLKIDLLSVTDQVDVSDLYSDYNQHVIIGYAVDKLQYFSQDSRQSGHDRLQSGQARAYVQFLSSFCARSNENRRQFQKYIGTTLECVSALSRKNLVDAKDMLPFIAMFGFRLEALQMYGGLFYSCDEAMCLLQVPLNMDNTVLDCFHRAMTYVIRDNNQINDGLLRKLALNDEAQSRCALRNIPSILICCLAQSGITQLLKQVLDKNRHHDDRLLTEFIDEVLDTESDDDRQIIIIALLEFLTSNLDFVLFLRNKLDVHKRIIKKVFADNDDDDDDDITSSSKLQIANLYLQLSLVAGPNERIAIDQMIETSPKNWFIGPKQQSASQDSPTKIDDELLPQFLKVVKKNRSKHVGIHKLLCSFTANANLISSNDENEDLNKNLLLREILSLGHSLGLLPDSDSGVKESIPIFGSYLTSVLFILMQGEQGRTLDLIKAINAQSGCVLPTGVCTEQDFLSTYTNRLWPIIDRVTERDLPSVRAALELSHVPLFHLTLFWLRQSFLAHLDWTQISQYLTLSILGGLEAQAAFFCTLLKHLERRICEQTQHSTLACWVTRSRALAGFKFNEHLQQWHKYVDMIEIIDKDRDYDDEV